MHFLRNLPKPGRFEGSPQHPDRVIPPNAAIFREGAEHDVLMEPLNHVLIAGDLLICQIQNHLKATSVAQGGKNILHAEPISIPNAFLDDQNGFPQSQARTLDRVGIKGVFQHHFIAETGDSRRSQRLLFIELFENVIRHLQRHLLVAQEPGFNFPEFLFIHFSCYVHQ